MERKIETVTMTTADGRVAKFEIVEDAERFSGRRAYFAGSTKYYEMPVFERGLAKPGVKVERAPA